MLTHDNNLWLILKTTQWGREDTYHQKKVMIMIFPLIPENLLTWMIEVTKRREKKETTAQEVHNTEENEEGGYHDNFDAYPPLFCSSSSISCTTSSSISTSNSNPESFLGVRKGLTMPRM
jgi:hypothetical protein